MKVLSFSVEEDWISGVSIVPVTYSAPYASKVPFFPADATAKYVASAATRDAVQPFTAVPWVATFAGCCRRYPAPDGVWSFKVTAYVDLTNSLGSPRIVTMPEVWLSQATSALYLCAIPAAGAASMTLASGGTLNYAADDGAPAGMQWQVMGFSLRAASGVAAAVSLQEPTGADVPNQSCRRFRIAGVPGDVTGYVGYVTVGCSIGAGCALGGCSLVTADISLSTFAAAAAGQQPAADAGSPFRCTNQADNGDYQCSTLVSAGFPLAQGFHGYNREALAVGAVLVAAYTSPAKPLELRYVVATARRQSGLLASAQGRVRYAAADSAADSAGLPAGMTLSSTVGIHDIQVRRGPARGGPGSGRWIAARPASRR